MKGVTRLLNICTPTYSLNLECSNRGLTIFSTAIAVELEKMVMINLFEELTGVFCADTCTQQTALF